MYCEYILIRYVSRSLTFKLEKARRCGRRPHLDTVGGGGGGGGGGHLVCGSMIMCNCTLTNMFHRVRGVHA